MADSLEPSTISNADIEGACGGASDQAQKEESELQEVTKEEASSSSTPEVEGQAEAATDEAVSGEGQSPNKNKKVSFNPEPIVISESEKEWNSSSKTTSSDTHSSDSSAPGACHQPSAQLAALHFRSRELLESQGLGDFTSDETSNDSEASDYTEIQQEVSSDELEKIKTHKLCQGKEELREEDVEILQKSFSFAKFKLEACLRRTLLRCKKEMSTFENMTEDLVSSFRDLFVILCIRSPLEERNYTKFTTMGASLVEKITTKSLAAFNRQFSQSSYSGGESAIKSWYSSAKLAVLKELSDMDKAESESAGGSSAASTSASN